MEVTITNVAKPLTPHLRQQCLCDRDCAKEIRIELLAQLRVGHVVRESWHCEARIIHQRMQWLTAPGYQIRDFGDLFAIRHVQRVNLDPLQNARRPAPHFQAFRAGSGRALSPARAIRVSPA